MRRLLGSPHTRKALLSQLRGSVVPPKRRPLHKLDSVLQGQGSDYLDALYEDWIDNPESVPEEIAALFEKSDGDRDAALLDKPLLRPVTLHKRGAYETPQTVVHALRVGWMLRLWAVRGHRLAKLDPLMLEDGYLRRPASSQVSDKPLFHPTNFGFKEHEMDQVFHLAVSDKIGGLLAKDTPPMTLRELYKRLQTIYSGFIGWEFMHIHHAEQLRWLRERIETPDKVGSPTALSVEKKKEVFRNLARAELFEKFLQTKFVGVKRFGIDGGEVLIPGLIEMLQTSSELGVENVVIGMPHRGRLSVLTNVAAKPLGSIFKEFQGDERENDFGSGDVKYHLGFSETQTLSNGKEISLSLVANPSHLEAVNPVVQGKTRAKQLFTGDKTRSKVMAVLLHGDAAFAGQGVCFETMGLNDLTEYTVGGTIHVVVNNQIGFTTDPVSSRSTPYCSDLGKMFGAPIFHVNGDSTEDVIRCFNMAAEWRARWKKDVVIDLVCYRRYGHNETDEPMFTQPLMYKKIKEHPTQMTIYGDHLVDSGALTREEVDEITKEVNTVLKEEYSSVKDYQHPGRSPRAEWLESFWDGFKSPTQQARIKPTSVPADVLRDLAARLTDFPAGFNLHPTVARILEKRKDTVMAGEEIDWSTAEALALGSLVLEGNHVRISGQDVERGTFSQRHAVVHDQENGNIFCPLESLSSDVPVTITNSSLSEFGVLGFELGYSSESPNQLVIWEAQFGDFANTAQVIFDQFLSAGEVKWYRQNGLVVNLPHGYDGAGPEHSSGRMERFLQMTPEPEDEPENWDPTTAIQKCNWQVCFPSTPAQYFHLLRSQVHRDFRKPLILFFSKATLRAPYCSSLSELTEGEFRWVIDDNTIADKSQVTRVILCTGQIYHFLKAERERLNRTNDIALVRIEMLAPFPWKSVRSVIEEQYPSSAEIMWAQDEPKNMGGWLFVEVRINSILSNMDNDREIVYNGRPPSAAPATGLRAIHDMEVSNIMNQAFS